MVDRTRGSDKENNLMNINTQIIKAKQRLIQKAKSKGICENFGQNEVRTLEEKYCDAQFSREDRQKEVWLKIRDFDNWCSRFDLSQL